MKIAKYLGFDLSTTALSVGVQGADGREDFVSVNMRGATEWNGQRAINQKLFSELFQPAFDLSYLPEMMEEVLGSLALKGWNFSKAGALSFSVRQHDMVVLDKAANLLMPALSWQCNAAAEETKWINAQKTIFQEIGPVEERFILPKLMWALKQEENLRIWIENVMTTGDYIAYMLTGIKQLGTSDAYCNGLLNKKNKKLAVESIGACGFLSSWFPPVVESGQVIGEVIPGLSRWEKVCSVLDDWKIISSLGDNHAGGVGCGLCSDEMIVISAGTSGTVIRIGHCSEDRVGEAACFENYDEELLLMMMARCASWYEDFAKTFGGGKSLADIDREIMSFAEQGVYFSPARVRQEKNPEGIIEIYPEGWENLSTVLKAISVQASIALELLLLVKKMLAEVTEPDAEIKKVVVTGGISRSQFFQEVLLIGLEILQPGLKLYVSAHQGPLAYKAAAHGALINAKFGVEGGCIPDVIRENCPTSEVSARGYLHEAITFFLQDSLI